MKKLLLKTLDALYLKDIAVEKWFSRKSKRFYATIVQNGDLVFDVGANIGNRSASFLAIGTKVVAFEPQFRCVEVLRQRFKGNPSIVIEKLGLADASGEMKLTTDSNSSVTATMSEKWVKEGRFANHDWDNYEMVSVSTLDHMIRKYGIPKFCKVDVEGFELNVFRGLTHPIEYISFEFTKEFLSDAIACIHHLAQIGPLEMNFSLGERVEYYNPSYADVESCLNQISSFHDKLLWGDIYIRMKK